MSAATAVPKARPAVRRATTASRVARPAPVRSPVRPAHRPPPGPRLRVVDPEIARRRRRVRIGLWCLGILGTASLLAVVAFHVLLAQGQLELDRVEDRIRQEQALYPLRRLAVAEASSPEAITARADALGLVDPAGPPTPVEVPEDPAATSSPSTASSSTADYERVKLNLDDPSP
jgi:hypothetical protein